MKWIICIALSLGATILHAQSRQSTYESLAEVHQEASILMQKGEMLEAQKILLKTDSIYQSKDNISTVLLAETYLETKKKSKALRSLGLKYLNKNYIFDFRNTKDKNDKWFYTVGKAFERKRRPKKALEVYKLGLKRHPTSGMLYRACGELQLKQNEPTKALNYFIKGVHRDPSYALNYYYMAEHMFKKDLVALAMIYAETYVVLSPHNSKAMQLSKQMFDQAMSNKLLAISAKVHISEGQKQLLGLYGYSRYLAKKSKEFQLGEWQAIIDKYVGNDFQSMAIARAALVDGFFMKQKTYANKSKLYKYHQHLKKDNLFDVYQFWLMGIGQPQAFEQYKLAHQNEVMALENWMKSNPLKLGKRKSKYLPSF